MPPSPTKPSTGRTVWLVLGILGSTAFLGFCVWGLIAAWNEAGEASPGTHLTGHGWAALIIAFVMVALLGGVLMWLAFYSARKGYDDRAGGGEED